MFPAAAHLHLLLPLLIAFGVSTGLTAYLASSRTRLCILDHPNERSLHHTPVSRTGGLAILGGMVAGLLAMVWMHFFAGLPFVLTRSLVWPALATSLVTLVSFWDDCSGVGVGHRFAVHAAAAVITVSSGLFLSAVELGSWSWIWPKFIGLVFSLLFLIWMTNLYNFMDGMDGFAGGMGALGFGFLGLFGWLAGDPGYALLCWITALACLGFLVFNFPPARIFMGDAGASTLGFWAAVLILWADAQGLFSFWAGILVFSPFIVDATVTLLRRLLAGEKIWQAHRSHYYQRLVQAGWSHRKTVLAEYAVMMVVGCAALVLLRVEETLAVGAGLAILAAMYVLLARSVTRLESRKHG
ncbi:MraY family glycosyltransferase [Desulfonatronum parangueonense]